MGQWFKTILMVVTSSCLMTVASAQTASTPKDPGPAISRLPISPQELAGGFWRIDHDFKPTLQITNVLKVAPLTVTPILYMADGTPYSLSPYKLAISGVVTIDLRAALEEAPPAVAAHVSEYGSVRIKYEWHWANAITASVQNIDVPRSLNFTFELRTPPAAKPTGEATSKKEKDHGADHSGHDGARHIIEEGLWWKRDSGVEGFVAITNISGSAAKVSLELLGDHGQVSARKRIVLNPQITQVLQLSELDPEKLIHAKAGGIRIQYDGTTHDLVVVGGLENGNEGYSANIPFGILADKPNPANPVSISAAGIMVGAPDPMMMFPAGTLFTPYIAMRNTSNRPLLVASSISYMDGESAKTVAVAPIKLLPGEARELNGTDFLARAGLAQFNGNVNLGFTFQGDGNDLLLATGSVDQKGTYVLPVEATGNGESESKWLKYWSVANGDDTMISLFNPGEKPEDLQMTLFFMDGQYKVPIHLEAKGSAMLMLGEIITAHQPDSDGHTIPFFIRQGSAILSSAAGEGELIDVSVSSSVFNVANATCGTTCPNCLGIVDFSVSPSATSTNIGGTLNYTATETNTSGGTANVTTRSSWSSSNSSVGSLQSAGAYKAMNTGAFLATAQLAVITPNPDCPEGQHNPCPTDPGEGSGGGAVKPSITGPNTVWWLNGQFNSAYPTQITLTSSAGASTTNWSVIAGGSKVNLSPQTGGTATVSSSGTVFSSGSGNDISVTVQDSSTGLTSDPFSLTTRTPSRLVMGIIPPPQCDSTFGYAQFIPYTIQDNLNANLPNPIGVNEKWTTTVSSDFSGTNWRRGSEGGINTDPSAPSQFSDEIQGENLALPPVPIPDCSGNAAAVEHWGQAWGAGSTTVGLGSVNGVQVQSDTIRKSVGKATVTVP